MPRRVAIIGIDGSGKSVLVRALHERFASAPHRLVAFHCPNFHETPDAPLGALSSRLKALSDASDAAGSYDLKLAALYLRMTLYGPVESFLHRTYRPANLVSERHPLIDTLVYVPLYQRARASAGAATPAPEVHERAAELAPGGFEAATAWLELQNRRLGRDTELAGLAADIVAACARPQPDVLAEFGARYDTTLPDVAVFLDVDVEQAARRLGSDRSTRELHEDERSLRALRDAYELVLPALPGVELLRISNDGRAIADTLEELIEVLELTGDEVYAPPR